jgi:hypothetical protein
MYAGPYSASTVTNGVVSSATFPIICDNYDTDVFVGLTWMAEGVTLSQEFSTPPSVKPPLKLEGSTNLSNLTSYDNGTPVTAEGAYEAAAWMAQQIMSIGSTDPNSLSGTQATEIADDNWAIWAIFSSGAMGNTSGFNSVAKTDLETALGNIPNYTLSEFNDVTFWIPYNSVPGGSCTSPSSTTGGCPNYNASQEYMTVSPAPEPASVLLFGTGLFGIILVLGKRLFA